MSLNKEISSEAITKLQLYTAALTLFENGRSYPQIVEILQEFVPDNELVATIVEKAMDEEWDKLSIAAREMYSKGMSYDEVIRTIKEQEPDEEIAEWICNSWYDLKIQLVDNIVDGSENRYEGLKWVIISLIIIPFTFYFETSWIFKAVWIAAFIVSALLWLFGIHQRRVQKKIERIFSSDIQNSVSGNKSNI